MREMPPLREPGIRAEDSDLVSTAPRPPPAIASGTLVPEVLGSIILASRPLIVVVCELAQESCRLVPTVGGTFGPCPELRGEVTLLDATTCWGGPDHAPAVELRATQAS